MRGHGLLHEFNIQTAILHGVQDAHGLLGLPRLIRVDAQNRGRARRLAHRRKPAHVQRRVRAHLDLQAAVAAANGFARILRHDLRIVDADGDVRFNPRAPTAQQPVDRQTVLLAVQIPHRHIHGGLGAGVLHDAGLNRLKQRLQRFHLAPDDRRGDMVANRAHDAGERVAGNFAGWRRFAPADRALVRSHLDHDVLHAIHRAQRRLEGHAQRHRQLPQANIGNFHGYPP